MDSLNIGRILSQYELFAFVIMPNHVHLIIRCLNGYTPGDVVREFKKATANLILRQYEAESNHEVLAFFASAVKPGQKQHAVWEDEYQTKNIFSPAFLHQKLEYIHHNPVQPHWRLVQQPEQYLWSSALFYLADGRALIPFERCTRVVRLAAVTNWLGAEAFALGRPVNGQPMTCEVPQPRGSRTR